MIETTVRTLEGGDLVAALDGLARLRLRVFEEWPYLYAGSLDYERWYLERFARAPDAVIVGAFAGDALVGAATAAPLRHEHEAFRAPFEAQGHDVGAIFYFAESVLLPAYRGRGLGHRFFDLREAHARRRGYGFATFCAVVRPADHTLRPRDYRPLDPFWQKRGYAPVSGLVTQFGWQDLDQASETDKPMQFWLKRLTD
ncbi:MAG: GNAT family N-acetyltransferase [Geminicoccaceae bacterium]|nr:MAG: GNAT family N-acetyltransferase [Geminicoccaceae bacterium]